MPKAVPKDRKRMEPVDSEEFARAQGLDPYDKAIGPVDVSSDGAGIRQPKAPSRFPEPEVKVEALARVKDRGFTFGRGAVWDTTREAAESLAPNVQIIAEL